MFNKNNKIIVHIEKMSCQHCAKKVEDALKELESIKKVKVNLEKKIAEVTLNDNLEDQIIKDKIEDLGYVVTKIEKNK